MPEQMSPKERWLAAINMQPADRLPFWPKLDAAYAPAQTGAFRNAPLEAIHQWIGSDQHVGLPPCVREVRRRTSVETTTSDGLQTTLYRCGKQAARMVKRYDEASRSWHPVEFPAKGLEDVRTLTECFLDCAVEIDAEALETQRRRAGEIGQSAVTHAAIGESPLMYWVEWMAGVQNAHYLLADNRQEVEALFEAMHRVLCRKAELLAERSPADVLYMVENTSTTLISPAQYSRYCRPQISEYGRIAAAHGKPLLLHMCGKLGALLGEMATMPVAGFEAFTSPPVGDTRLPDGRKACPDKCLVGGTNATLWLRPADQIVAELERDLSSLPHHRGLVITSAGVMPPRCPPHVIKAVRDWVASYPARM